MLIGGTVRVVGTSVRFGILGAAAPALPASLFLLGRSRDLEWLIDRQPADREVPRLNALVGHLDRLQRKAGEPSAWWALACLADGWREDGTSPQAGGSAGTANLPWDRPSSVMCFGKRAGDTSGLLVAEPHYFMYGRYRKLMAKVRLLGLPWAWRKQAAVYAGGDHGRSMNLPGGGEGTPRRLLAQRVAELNLPVRVALGQGVSVAEQMRYRVILDVDGHARTWEAWAWKMLCGSVVISQASEWQTRLTTEFQPGVHFLQTREDFQDLGEVLEWCRSHWSEARRLARNARARARAVYSTAWVENADEWRRISAALRPLPGPLSDTHPA